MNITGDSTDVTTYFTLRLTATGAEATALDVTTFDLQSVRTGSAPSAKVDATALAATDSAHADNKAIEVDATDQPGLFRVDWPDAPFAAGVREVILTVKCATCFTEHLRVTIDAPVNVTKLLGTAWATPATAGLPDVNAKQISTSATAADNLETAALAYSATRGLAGTALPAAAADAAGGLPISDAGGLDLDAKLANTNEVTAARMGALTDWINGGRLDLILDIIAADTTTDIPALIAALNNLDAADIRTAVGLASANIDTQLSAIAGFIDAEVATLITSIGAGLNTLVVAVKAKTDLLPAIPASQTKLDTVESLASGVNGFAALKVDTAAILDDTGTSGVVVAAGSKAGYALSSAGLDVVLVESSITAGVGLTDDAGTQLTSINARQALAAILSANAAVLAGAATANITIKQAAKPSGNTRIDATVDGSGNRSAITMKVPT